MMVRAGTNLRSRITHFLAWGLLCVGGWPAAAWAQADPASGSRPNIVVILADDLGWGDVSANQTRSTLTTPRIDSIAAAGMNFSDAHSAAAVCSPSRYALLTGRYGWRRLKADVLGDFATPLIDADMPTLGSMLQGRGYRTAAIGKWHLGLTFPRVPEGEESWVNRGRDLTAETEDGPVDRGFDEFFGIYGNIVQHPRAYIRGRRLTAYPDQPHVPTGQLQRSVRYVARDYNPHDVLDRLTDEAVEFIERSAGQETPFFLYFSLTAPHVPLIPAARFQGTSGLGLYGDFVKQVDWTVGEVLDSLDRAGIAEDTLLVFTSDNGSYMKAHQASGRGHLDRPGSHWYSAATHKPNGDWRGIKGEIYEGGHRVPFLVRWPGVVEAGSETAFTTAHVDLYATVADIVGERLDQEEAIDSLSMLPVLRGEQAAARRSVVHHSARATFAIRSGGWKLVAGTGSGGWSGGTARPGTAFGRPYQLYDLSSGPAESNDVIDANSSVAERLEARLTTIRTSTERSQLYSNDASLGALALSGIGIGAFADDVSTYAAQVAHGVTSTTVTATPADEFATVVISDGITRTAGPAATMELVEGENTITVTVTAEDMTATRTYTVGVTRALFDFEGLQAAGNNSPRGMWSDGETVWVTDYLDSKIYAYDAADGRWRPSRDLDTLEAAGNTQPTDIWSNGETLWVADYWDARLYAYRLSDGARTADRDVALATANADPNGLWGDGETLWVVDKLDARAYAYRVSDGSRDATREFVLSNWPRDEKAEAAWSDGDLFWIVGFNARKAFAFRDGARVPEADIGVRSRRPVGLWSNGRTLWVSEYQGNSGLLAHALPTPSANASLTLLKLSNADLGPFEAARTAYWGRVANATSVTTLSVTPAAGANIEVTPVDADAATAGHQVRLAVGANRIALGVTAADGTTKKTYAVAVTRDSANAAGRDVGVSAPATARFGAVPDGHDGTAFAATFELNEDIEGIGDAWVRDALVSATNATVTRASRVAASSNAGWELAVEPSGAGDDATLSIAAGTALPDGRRLSAGDSVTVPGQSLAVAGGAAAEGAGTQNFTVRLDRGATGTVTVSYATADGTATAGSDYTAASGTLTFAAGESARTVSVALLDDDADEEDETFTLTLTRPSGAALADATATGTIWDDDVATPAKARFTAVADGHGGTAFTARLEFNQEIGGVDAAWVRDTLVSATNATVTRASRVSPPSNVGWELHVEPSSAAASATLSIAAERVLPVLPDGRVLSAGDSVTVPGQSLSVADGSADEGGTAEFAVSLDRAATGTVTVSYATADGTATAGTDYAAVSGTLTFAPGESAKTISVALLDDDADEEDETFTLTLSGAAGAAIAAATATGTIRDDDVTTSVTARFTAVPDGHDGSRFAASFSFSEEIEGMGYAWVRDTLVAASGATVGNASRAAPPANLVWNLDVVPLSPGADATLSIAAGTTLPDGRTLSAGDSATVPGQSLSVADGSADEGGAAEFAVTLDRGATGTVTVSYATADGTATAGTDYTAVSGTLTFAPGESAKTISVALLDDDADEEDETFALTLSSASGAALAVATATGTILDADGPAARFGTVPAEHDGASPFSAGLAFNEDPSGLSYVWVRDTLVTASNGTVSRASRVSPPSNLEWDLEVTPSAAADVVLSLAAGLELPDGRTLSVGEPVTVRGPAPQGASVNGPLLTLTWDSDRDQFGEPSSSDYAVSVNGESRLVSRAAIAGRSGLLLLAKPVSAADIVEVGYLGSAMHPLAEASGRLRSTPWDGLRAENVTGRAETPPLTALEVAAALKDDPLATAPADAVRLDASGLGLERLSGIGRLTALERVDLSGNALSDLGPLSVLGTLRELDLSDNRIVDLAPLGALWALERVDLSGNRVTDLGPLAELPALRVLLLDGNEVVDLGPLTHSSALENLGLADNRVMDATALQDLPRLRRLDLGGNPAMDLSPLGDIDALVWITLPGEIAAAPDAIGRLTRLRWVWPGRAHAEVEVQ